MVNLDNVLCVGLMLKYIDIFELVVNVKFEVKLVGELLIQLQCYGVEFDFLILVEDFVFFLYDFFVEVSDLVQVSVVIVFCVDGEVVLCKGDQSLIFKLGELVFVVVSELLVQVSGCGCVVCVFNKFQ